MTEPRIYDNGAMFTVDDGALCLETFSGGAIKLRTAQDAYDLIETIWAEANRHFGVEFATFTPSDCGRLEPRAATFEERHAANEATLAELAKAMGLDK